MEEGWHEIQGYLREVFSWAGVDGLEAEELSVIPGLDEIFSLTDIKGFAESGEWDVVVVDCAPTAETIRFLSLPDILVALHGAAVPGGPPGQQGDRAGAVARHLAARRRRRRVRERRARSTTASTACARS